MTDTVPAAAKAGPGAPLVRSCCWFRYPGTSTIHELWAGTKLLVVFGVSVLLTFYPGWVTIGLLGGLVLAAARIARIPRGAMPSVPRWLWFVIALGGVTAALAGGSPVISVGGLHIGLGGALHFLRITALSIVLLGLGAMVSWTTNVAEIGPALATLGRPLKTVADPGRRMGGGVGARAARLPDVDRRIPGALRRPPAASQTRYRTSRKARRRQHARELIDLLATAMIVTLRRADEMGDAITARGGTGQLSASPARPKLADWVTLGHHRRGRWQRGGDRDDFPSHR